MEGRIIINVVSGNEARIIQIFWTLEYIVTEWKNYYPRRLPGFVHDRLPVCRFAVCRLRFVLFVCNAKAQLAISNVFYKKLIDCVWWYSKLTSVWWFWWQCKLASLWWDDRLSWAVFQNSRWWQVLVGQLVGPSLMAVSVEKCKLGSLWWDNSLSWAVFQDSPYDNFDDSASLKGTLRSRCREKMRKQAPLCWMQVTRKEGQRKAGVCKYSSGHAHWEHDVIKHKPWVRVHCHGTWVWLKLSLSNRVAFWRASILPVNAAAPPRSKRFRRCNRPRTGLSSPFTSWDGTQSGFHLQEGFA